MAGDLVVPPVVVERYPESAALLGAYAELVANEGVAWGLVGPREVPRLWERHILNCSAVADLAEGLVGVGAAVVDVGSGAGFPGLVWAMTRTDLSVTLVEPLLRRVKFLELVVAELGLRDRVQVVRSRAEDCVESVRGDIVTARAVAPLDKLVRWLLPLCAPDGRVLALKGATAVEEVEGACVEMGNTEAGSAEVVTCGNGWLEPPTTVVVVTRQARTKGKEAQR